MGDTPAWSDFVTSFGVGCLILGAFLLVLSTRRSFEKAVNERILTALNRRRKDGDTFREDNGYGWDYVMVFRVYGCEEAIHEGQVRTHMQTHVHTHMHTCTLSHRPESQPPAHRHTRTPEPEPLS